MGGNASEPAKQVVASELGRGLAEPQEAPDVAHMPPIQGYANLEENVEKT